MNATRQVISQRLVSGLGPRLTAPTRHASTAVGHHSPSSQDRKLMHGVFTVGTLGTVGVVAYGATRSGGRVNTRYSKKNSSLDSSKWFAESSDINHEFITWGRKEFGKL